MTNTSSRSSNVYLFYGEDTFSIRRKVDEWRQKFAEKHSASGIVTLNGEKLDATDLAKKFEEVLAPSLFSEKKLIICNNCLPHEAVFDLVSKLPRDYFLVFWQTIKLDRRLALTKKILALPMTAQECRLPHGKELAAWIKTELQKNGATIEEQAVETLAVYLGRDLFEEKKS